MLDTPQRMMRLAVLPLVVFTCALVAADKASAQATKELSPQQLVNELNRTDQKVYAAYRRIFCDRFYHYGTDDFCILPNYRNNILNSSGRTMEGVKEDLTIVEYDLNAFNVIIKERTKLPPRTLVQAIARTLPEMDVGHYGFLDAVRVEQVLGPMEMIVTQPIFAANVAKPVVPKKKNKRKKKNTPPPKPPDFDDKPLRDALKRQEKYKTNTYRLIGFPTEKVLPGNWYRGPDRSGIQVAVVSTEPGTAHHAVLHNVERMRPTHTDEFAVMLDYIDMTPTAFIERVQANRKKHGNEKGDGHTLTEMYLRFYKRYQPDAPGASGNDQKPNQSKKWTFDPDEHSDIKIPKFSNIHL